MKITKQIHEFIHNIFFEHKPIQIFNFVSLEWENVDTSIFKSKYNHEYDLRITPDIKYCAGNRFVDLKGNEYQLIIDTMIDYYEDHVIVHNTFYLMLLFNGGNYHSKIGESVTVKNKNYITQEQFKFLSNEEINTKELVKI